ncbi:MAG TPA: hypothetical protein VHO95_13035, partial [Candidatus Dormibacteraeota bacterium]|nr:hypothetical protein [Candidatus Dormibacteraeota bacterium]
PHEAHGVWIETKSAGAFAGRARRRGAVAQPERRLVMAPYPVLHPLQARRGRLVPGGLVDGLETISVAV